MAMPFTTGLAAAVAVLGVLGPLPALGATAGAASTSVRSQEWWLASLHVTQAWQTSVGAGITVAVLDTGVETGDADLSGDVTTGPDFTGSGRRPGSPYWGFNGTSVAGIIAGHGHGPGDRSGIIGIAPAARILSVRVTLEFNDPLSSDATLSRRLPGAIADGITYAVAHGARIIDLPLDPGTLGITGHGDPAAGGGSPAEHEAVEYALDKSVVLVAPAGDDGMGPGIVDYPAAYPGVVAVGAVGRGGQLAPFSSRHSYVSLTAPGVGLEVAVPPDGYQAISSTSAASGVVAGVAALIMSRFPHLTAAQVTQALTESTADVAGASGLPPLPARSPSGAGYGTVDAARAIQMAALITAASQPPPVQPVRPRKPKPTRRPAAAPRRPGASALAGSVLRAALAGVGVLIVLLVVMLLVMRSRRGRGRAPAAGTARARARAPGLHEQRRPDRAPAPPVTDQGNGTRGRPQATQPGPPAADLWPAPGGWQGGGIGAIAPTADPPFRPAVTAAPRTAAGHRSGRGAGADGNSGGPPWTPAPEPGRTLGPLPVASPGSPPPEPGPGIRVPGDMAVPPAAASEPPAPHPLAGLDTPTPPAGFAMTPPLSGFGPPPAAFGFDPSPAVSDAGPVPATEFPARADLGFAAAPVADDYVAPFPAEPAAEQDPAPGPAADPSFIWDLAATDVFPAVAGGDPRTGSGPPTETAGGPDLPS
jgi:serine protease